MESPMLTRIKRKKQEDPSYAQIGKELLILKAAVLVAVILITLIITKFG